MRDEKWHVQKKRKENGSGMLAVVGTRLVPYLKASLPAELQAGAAYMRARKWWARMGLIDSKVDQRSARSASIRNSSARSEYPTQIDQSNSKDGWPKQQGSRLPKTTRATGRWQLTRRAAAGGWTRTRLAGAQDGAAACGRRTVGTSRAHAT